MSGFRGNNLQAIKLADAKGDITATGAMAWSTRSRHAVRAVTAALRRHPLLPEDELTACCRRSTRRRQAALPGCSGCEGVPNVFASPVGADGRVYITGRDGVTTRDQARHRPTRCSPKNTLDDGFDASPALVDNEMFMRGFRYLYAIGQ